MSNHPNGGTAQPTDSHRGLRLLALAAVVVGVLLLMAAAFVLSYSGIHAVALSAGVSPRLARLYPLIFDAMLVIACAAVLALRGAGLPSRCYAWLTMLVLLAAAAGADTLHATGAKLQHKPAAAAAAIIPWALVLIGFGLLLSLLRQARLRRAGLAAAQQRAFVPPSGHIEVRHGIDDLLGPPGVTIVKRASAKADQAGDSVLDLAIDIEPGHDDPVSDEGHLAASSGTPRGRPDRKQQPAGSSGRSASAFSPAPTLAPASDPGTETVHASGRSTEARTMPVPDARPAPEPTPALETTLARDPTPTPNATPPLHPTPAPDARTAPDTGLTTDAPPAPDARTESPPGTAQVAEYRPMPEPGPASDRPIPEARPTPEAGSDHEAAPTPAVLPQFDRKRSSPTPPEAGSA
jgi:Protein of unknown function (DUF2637)